MATTQTPRTERPQFYEQQYLGARDLTRIVEYFRDAEARHALGAHIWGIAAGLQIVERPSQSGGPLEVWLEPGFAWDGFARQISVLAPQRLSPALFASLTWDPSDANPPGGRLVPLWIRYRETPAGGPDAGFELCTGDDQCARAIEEWGLVAGVPFADDPRYPDHSDRHDPVSVAGYGVDARTVPEKLGIPGRMVGGVQQPARLADESIAYQAFPTDPDARWLVPLGVVRWLPPNGAVAGGFRARVESAAAQDLTIHERARRYIGVVAGTVNAEGRSIRMRRRDAAFDPSVWSDDLAWVEGSARVDGDLSLLGTRLVLRDTDYTEHGDPLTIGRREGSALGGRDMVVQVGAHEAGANRLVVGPYVAPPAGGPAVLKEKVVVKDDGSVGIGETNPDRPLVVRGRGAIDDAIGLQNAAGSTRWSLALNAGAPGLHVRDVAAAATRVYVKEGGDVGIGTTAPTQNLHVVGSRGIRQNELYLTGGDGNRWSSLAFNAHHDAANAGWVYPNPGRRAATLEMDDSGGSPRFEFWSTTNAGMTTFIRRLAVDGESGQTLLVPNGGDVGVGTVSPQARLHVDGGTGLRVGRLHMSGGSGANLGSSLSFNAHRDAANAAWVFPDAAHTAVTLEMDDVYGRSRFEVWSTTTAAKGSWQQRLALNGENGDFVVAHNGGNVGLGLAAPATRLHLRGSQSGPDTSPTGHLACFENTSQSSDADVLALSVGTTSANLDNNFITFFNGNSALGAIQAISFDLNNLPSLNDLFGIAAGLTSPRGIMLTSGTADFAEWMLREPGEPAMRPGDVVGVHGGRISRRIEGAERLMVISTAPLLLGNRPPDQFKDRFERVAFIGSAPVRVQGPVARGDFLLAEEGSDGTATAVAPDALALDDLPRVVAVAWGDVSEEGVHVVPSGVGLPPSRHVWSLLARALAGSAGHGPEATEPPVRPRLKRKKAQ